VIKYGIGKKLGRELLPAPVSAPLNAPFWGQNVHSLSGRFSDHDQDQMNIQQAKPKRQKNSSQAKEPMTC
jgi:hypothetical protein